MNLMLQTHLRLWNHQECDCYPESFITALDAGARRDASCPKVGSYQTFRPHRILGPKAAPREARFLLLVSCWYETCFVVCFFVWERLFCIPLQQIGGRKFLFMRQDLKDAFVPVTSLVRKVFVGDTVDLIVDKLFLYLGVIDSVQRENLCVCLLHVLAPCCCFAAVAAAGAAAKGVRCACDRPRGLVCRCVCLLHVLAPCCCAAGGRCCGCCC